MPRPRLAVAAVVAVALAQPSCLPGDWLEWGTPAGEHAPTGPLATVVRDSLAVTLSPTRASYPERAGGLRALVEAAYRVEGDTLRLVLPTESDDPARAWLDGRELAPRADTVGRSALRPASVQSDSAYGGPDPTTPDAVPVHAFETSLNGPARVRVRYFVRPDRELRASSPHGVHVVRLGWAPGVGGARTLRVGGARSWDVAAHLPGALADTLLYAHAFAEGADVAVVATRPWSGAGVESVRWLLLLAALTACGAIGWRAGRVLDLHEGARPGWARVGEGALRVGFLLALSLGIGLGAAFVTWLLALGFGPRGDSWPFMNSNRLALLGYATGTAGVGSLTALVAGGVRWVWTGRLPDRP